MLRILFFCCVLIPFAKQWIPNKEPRPMGKVKGKLYPFVVAFGLESEVIKYRKKARTDFKKPYINDMFKMAGTIIHPQYVLTTAYVWAKNNFTSSVNDNVTDWFVTGAFTNKIPVPSLDHKTDLDNLTVNRVILHPNYQYEENKTFDIYNLALAVFFKQLPGVEITRAITVRFSNDYGQHPMERQSKSDIKIIFWLVAGNFTYLQKYFLLLDFQRPCLGVTAEGYYCFWGRICGEQLSPCAWGVVSQGVPIMVNNEMHAVFTGYKGIGCHLDLAKPLTGVAVLDLFEKQAADPNLHVASDFFRFYIGTIEEYRDIFNESSKLQWITEKPIPDCVMNKGTRDILGLVPVAVYFAVLLTLMFNAIS